MVSERLLSVQKAAYFLDVSTSSIRRWAQSGELTGLKIGSRGDWRFTKDDLMNITRKANGAKKETNIGT